MTASGLVRLIAGPGSVLRAGHIGISRHAKTLKASDTANQLLSILVVAVGIRVSFYAMLSLGFIDFLSVPSVISVVE
jgi:hypothetical protein